MSRAGARVLITGGGTGIGAACARRFAAEGARVAVMGRRKELIEAVAQEIGGLAFAADAGSSSEMRAAVETLRQRFGGLDTLVHSAGGLGSGDVLSVDDAAWRACMHANLDTAFVAARESLPMLIESRGSIVIVSSVAGLEAVPPQMIGYNTSKHALIGFTRSLAHDYGPKGVRVNAICPGWVRTPMADEEMGFLMNRDGLSLDEAYGLVSAEVPMRRAAEPEEIAAVCAFLASKDAAIVSGAILPVDGGSTTVCVGMLPFVRPARPRMG